jgi:hypothetical protein
VLSAGCHVVLGHHVATDGEERGKLVSAAVFFALAMLLLLMAAVSCANSCC